LDKADWPAFTAEVKVVLLDELPVGWKAVTALEI